MPNKPSKYGLKVWVVCDAKSSYAWRMQAYTGRPASSKDSGERNLAERVVLDLTSGLQHRSVTCDNFFTSHSLAQLLLNRHLTVLGTIRLNRNELPSEMVSAKGREVLSTQFLFHQQASLISYVPKKNKTVVLLSTRHPRPDVDHGRRDKKPKAILDYNTTKGGVDNLDKLLATYSCRRMTKRWPVALFHNIIDTSAYNAFVLWRETHPEWMARKRNRRRLFLEQLGRALVTPLMQTRAHAPRAQSACDLIDSIKEQPTPLLSGKRKRCQLCPRARDIKTRTVCVSCNKYICGKCTRAMCYHCCNLTPVLS